MEEKEMVFRDSRKMFWWAYAGVLAVIVVVGYASLSGTADKAGLILSAMTIAVGLLLPELARAWRMCKINRHQVEVVTGIVHRRHRRLLTSMIAEVHIHQKFLQRLLNYGVVSISSMAQGDINLGTFNKPKKIVAEIEKLIHLDR